MTQPGGADILAVQQRLEGLQDGSIGRLGQQAQQLAVALDEAAQDARDGECPVTMRHGRENPTRQLLGKKGGALGLATAADASLAATEGHEMFGMTLWTAQAGKASFQAATGEELFDRAHDDGPQGPGTGLETSLVSLDVADVACTWTMFCPFTASLTEPTKGRVSPPGRPISNPSIPGAFAH
jgi:hypothetical protein